MFAVLFTLLLVLVAIGGYGVFVYDTNPEGLAKATRWIGLTLLVVLAVSGAVVYAAEIRPTTCNDLPKYGLLWYSNFCFIYESSS